MALVGTLGVVRPLAWFKNAPLRTIRSLAERLADPDDSFARSRLPDAEYRLYASMDARDREHAVAVTRTLLSRYPDASDALVRAALLHDVGKTGRPYRVWERVLVHLWTPADIAAQPRVGGWKGAWQVQRHHAAYGAELVRKAGGSERVADLIARHHAKDAGPEAAKLRAVDELT